MIKWLKEKFRRTPKRWFTSDLHFSHRNVIPYCNRPFKDVEEMNAHIIKTWNKTVKPFDTIYVLGDFSLNPNWSKRIVPLLNGHKVLVAGNHDGCHISQKKCSKFLAKYLNDWHEVMIHWGTLTLKNDRVVIMSHLPYDNEYDDRYKQYKLADQGFVLLHGHLHGRYIKNGKQIDVSWDAHAGKILSEDELIDIINSDKDYIPSHLTEYYKNRKDDRNEAT